MPIQIISRAAEPDQPTPAFTIAYRTIPVTNGPLARCDEEDFAFLSRFTWRVKYGTRIHYPFTGLGGQDLYMHHLVLMNGAKRRVNHRDRDGFNNCRGNLRVASGPQVEAAKAKSVKRIFTSQYKGVHRCQNATVWHAKVSVASFCRWLGSFHTEESAARAYDAAAREEFGEFAYQNFPSKAA